MMNSQETLNMFHQVDERTKREYHGSELDVPIDLRDHGFSRKRRVSARQAGNAVKPEACTKCPGCRTDQVLNSTQWPQHSVTSSKVPNKRKRKRSKGPGPIKSSAEYPKKMNLVPRSRSATSPAGLPVVSDMTLNFQPSSADKHSVPSSNFPKNRKRKRRAVSGSRKPSAEFAQEMNLLPRPQSTISPADLPVVSKVPLSPEPSITDNQLSSTGVNHDGPLKIHNYSVEEYQQIYHEVVDEMLRFKNGRIRPYSIQLGRKIKQRLWEKLDRPMISTSANEDGRVNVITSYRVGVYPPLHDVDILGEPTPKQPPQKRAKNLN